MLVLSRQLDESIVIGDNVIVTIVDIRGDKVRLGIQAPDEIPVHRREVYDAIQREENRAKRLERDVHAIGGSGNVSRPERLLPRFYETILLPGENFDFNRKQRGLYNLDY